MTLEGRLILLAQAIGADIKTLKSTDGSLSSLSTTNKTSLVAAINELVSSIGSAGAANNDTALAGNLVDTWSANKILESLELAKIAVTDSLTNGASAALNTLSELATALGNDPSFATTIATEISNRVRFDAIQTLTALQQAQALANIGGVAIVTIGNADADLVATYVASKV